MRLAGNRSASPDNEMASVPAMNPPCTAFVNHPIPASVSPQAVINSGPAPLALNHSEVQSNSETATPAMAMRGGILVRVRQSASTRESTEQVFADVLVLQFAFVVALRARIVGHDSAAFVHHVAVAVGGIQHG